MGCNFCGFCDAVSITPEIHCDVQEENQLLCELCLRGKNKQTNKLEPRGERMGGAGVSSRETFIMIT